MAEETIVSEVVAASLGGAVSASILYPLEVLKCKMQAVDEQDDDDDESNKSMIPFALKVYQKEGSSVFFRGVETSALQSALEKALYFFAYTFLKELHTFVTKKSDMSAAMNLALGCAAEWAHLPITLPVDAWTTKIQTSNEAPFKILLTMLGDKNCNFYKGLSAYTLLCFKPALQYTIYEQVKTALLASRRNTSTSLSAMEAFVLGMVARTVATVLVFPFLRAKVLLQTAKATDTSQDSASSGATNNGEGNPLKTTRPLTTYSVLLHQWQRAGLAGLYQGIGPELTRGIFSSALMLMIKERIAVLVHEWLLRPKQQHSALRR
jgi:solute carrier family 25 (peroxisomal adenine nucleotide transporter), member 17